MNTIAWRGLGRLLADGVVGVSHIAEGLQTAIVERIPIPGRLVPRTVGSVAGIVYRSVRGVAHGSAAGLDLLLRTLKPGAEPFAGGPAARQWRAIANGVLGDHLAQSGNPLALPMRLWVAGSPVAAERTALADALASASPRLLLLVHGLCMAPEQWRRNGHDHGAALAAAHGYTPVYVEYNSGRHVSQNAAELSQVLQQLLDAWPLPLERFAIVAHSMGGLLARSACHQASALGHDWPRQLDDLVFLGTPHHGAPMERVGHAIDRLLQATPYSAPFAMLGGMRSAGITDLRRGDLLEADWAHARRHPRRSVPLPRGVRCRAVAAALHEPGSARAQHWIGDGLVPLTSALGEHDDPGQALAFARSSRMVVDGAGHFDLLDDARVRRRLLRWLGPDSLGHRAGK